MARCERVKSAQPEVGLLHGSELREELAFVRFALPDGATRLKKSQCTCDYFRAEVNTGDHVSSGS